MIANPNNFTKSAILNTKRPIDKVFHSIIVSTEIVLVRKNYFGEQEKYHVHIKSDKMITQTLEALHSLTNLNNYKDLVTKRGQFIMQKCYDLLHEIAMSKNILV